MRSRRTMTQITGRGPGRSPLPQRAPGSAASDHRLRRWSPWIAGGECSCSRCRHAGSGARRSGRRPSLTSHHSSCHRRRRRPPPAPVSRMQPTARVFARQLRERGGAVRLLHLEGERVAGLGAVQASRGPTRASTRQSSCSVPVSIARFCVSSVTRAVLRRETVPNPPDPTCVSDSDLGQPHGPPHHRRQRWDSPNRRSSARPRSRRAPSRVRSSWSPAAAPGLGKAMALRVRAPRRWRGHPVAARRSTSPPASPPSKGSARGRSRAQADIRQARDRSPQPSTTSRAELGMPLASS